MKEIKRSAKVGEKIKITKEHQRLGGPTAYPLGSIWVVRKVLDEEKGLVFCHGNTNGKFAEEYVVIQE